MRFAPLAETIQMRISIVILMNLRLIQFLERLANSGLIRKENTLLDYGCGKGRVDFFMSYQTRCQSIGVEYNERIYEKAMNNKESAVASGRVLFALANAERYTVPETVDGFIF